MKHLTLFLFFVISLLAHSTNAQVSSTAVASATIVSPINILKTDDLNFGNVAVSSNPGTISITPGSTRQITGGVTLPSATGNPGAASFTVSGEPSFTYAITLPTTVTISSGADDMIITNFESMPSGTGTLISGLQVLQIGATLQVDGSQVPGTYISTAPFEVTVNYN